MDQSSALSGHLVAVKTLKITFRKLFFKLADLNLIFANSRSVSAMPGHLFSVLLQSKLIWLAVLSSNNGFMNSMRRVFINIF